MFTPSAAWLAGEPQGASLLAGLLRSGLQPLAAAVAAGLAPLARPRVLVAGCPACFGCVVIDVAGDPVSWLQSVLARGVDPS